MSLLKFQKKIFFLITKEPVKLNSISEEEKNEDENHLTNENEDEKEDEVGEENVDEINSNKLYEEGNEEKANNEIVKQISSIHLNEKIHF